MGTRVRVPDYQRSYSWDREQAEDLYTDIDRFQKRFPGRQIENEEYFLGALVGIREGLEFRILDGQQRLATITILFSSIRDALAPVDEESASDLHRDLIQERPRPGEPLQSRMSLSVYDQEFFESFIQRFPRLEDTAPVRASHRLIRKVRDYFDREIAAGIEGKRRGLQVEWLIRLWVVASTALSVVVVEAENEEDATEVFEVLNERGAGLSTMDLLRNFLLGAAANDRDRERIIDAWGEVFTVSDTLPRVQAFLRHYWVSHYGDVKARGLYREIKYALQARFDDRDDDPVEFSLALSASSERYRSMLEASTGDVELNEVVESVDRLGAPPLYPAMLSAMETFDEAQTVPLARALLSHYVRWTVIGKRESTELESQVFGISKDLRSGLTIRRAINRLRRVTLSDEEFTGAFRIASLTRAGHRRHVLEALERYLRRVTEQDEVEPRAPNELHVEHIYPQTPTDDAKFDDHDDWVNRIGNLTLLRSRWNQRIRNGDFARVKLPDIRRSVILLNQSVARRRTWTRAAIEERQDDFAEIAPRVWPI